MMIIENKLVRISTSSLNITRNTEIVFIYFCPRRTAWSTGPWAVAGRMAAGHSKDPAPDMGGWGGGGGGGAVLKEKQLRTWDGHPSPSPLLGGRSLQPKSYSTLCLLRKLRSIENFSPKHVAPGYLHGASSGLSLMIVLKKYCAGLEITSKLRALGRTL